MNIQYNEKITRMTSISSNYTIPQITLININPTKEVIHCMALALLFIPEFLSDEVLSPADGASVVDGVLSPDLAGFGAGAAVGGFAPNILYGSRTSSIEYTASGKEELIVLVIVVLTTPVEILTYIAIKKFS